MILAQMVNSTIIFLKDGKRGRDVLSSDRGFSVTILVMVAEEVVELFSAEVEGTLGEMNLHGEVIFTAAGFERNNILEINARGPSNLVHFDYLSPVGFFF